MRVVFVAITMAVLFAGSAAFADARQHFMSGKDYYAQAKYQKAIDEFEEAYRLDPRPLLLYNISQAYEKLGNLKKTIDTLKKFLEAEPDTDDRPALLAKIANLEARIAKTGVKLVASEAEATVYVDGKEVGKTPMTGIVQLPPGQHKVKVAKKGFSDFKMAVSVSSGLTAKVEVELDAGRSSLDDKVADVQPDDGEDGEVGEENSEGIEGMDVVPWVLAGVGAAAVVVGWGVIGSMAVSQGDASGSKDEIADAIAFPGLALAAAGTIWGIVRIQQKKKNSDEDPTGADMALVPVIGGQVNGVAAVVQF